MLSLQPRSGHGLLRCPLCRVALTAAAGALVCRNRHSFDFARAGYVNLLPSSGRRPVTNGDTPAQLAHRAAVLDAGYFAGIAAAVVQHIRGVAPALPRSWCVLDAGSGTGHHLAAIAAALPTPVVGLGLDIGKDAARLASRRWPTLAFAVADLWAEWPVRDGSIDLVVSIFAPKNFAEAARVLRPNGWLAVAYPGPSHLAELVERFRLMRRDERAPYRYAAAVTRYVGLPSALQWRTRQSLDAASVRSAILMGPNARHIAPSILDAVPPTIDVTFDIHFLFARKR